MWNCWKREKKPKALSAKFDNAKNYLVISDLAKFLSDLVISDLRKSFTSNTSDYTT